MPEGVAAFSNPLAKATWGIEKTHHRPGTGGVNQMVRFTFTNPVDAFGTTLTVLKEMVDRYVDDPEVIRFTRRLFNGKRLRNHDELGEIAAIAQYFQGTHTIKTPDNQVGSPLLSGDKGSYRYQKDPYSRELFQSPPKVLRDIETGESGADCDDIAATAACCLAAAGYPAMLMIVDAGTAKGEYNHVMLATKTMNPNSLYGSDWFPIELIHPLGLGKSVKIKSYIPLLVEPYDITSKTRKLIPAQFR